MRTFEDVALRGGDEVKDARVKTTLREEHRMQDVLSDISFLSTLLFEPSEVAYQHSLEVGV